MRTLPILFVLLLPIVAASGQTVDGPNVIDPAGDAGFPAPVPQLYDWGDITAIWFEDETEDAITAHIGLVAPSAPPVGEVALRFTSNGTHYLTGWTTVVFPAPPFVYEGGFICTANSAFEADPADCTDASGVQWTDEGLAIPIRRHLVGAEAAGATFGRVSAYSDQFAFGGVVMPVDRTAEGREHVFTTGTTAGAEPEADGGPAKPDTKAQPATPTTPAGKEPVTRQPEVAESPSAAPSFALLLLAVGAAMRRRT